MKLVVVYQYYQSTEAPGHSLIYDWTQYLANGGHDVLVVAGETGYMRCDEPSRPWYRRLIRHEQVGQVRVCRTYTYSKLHRGYGARLLGFFSFSMSCFMALLFQKKPDVIFASSPPLFPIFSTWFVCKLRRIPLILEVRDLWPESAVQMGILKNSLLIRTMAWMEKKVYEQSRTIIALTPGIRKRLCERGYSEQKVVFIPGGVDISLVYPDLEGAQAIRKRLHLESQKIVLYFGALGAANNIPVILRAAKHLLSHQNIVFMLVGDGMQRRCVERLVDEMKLTNVLLHQAVPKNQARHYITAADLCLVTLLDVPLFHSALPTKLFDYMACNKPVLCGVGGEAKRLVEACDGGFSFAPNDDKGLAKLILKTLQDIDNGSMIAMKSRAFIETNHGHSGMCELIKNIV